MVTQDDRAIVQRLIKERQVCIDSSVKAMRHNNGFLAQVLAGLGGYLELAQSLSVLSDPSLF